MNRDEYARMRAVEDAHWWYRGLRALVWQLWSAAPDKPDGPLLDVGCGTGGTLAGAPREGFGIDFSPEALRLCRERGQTRLARADASALPYRDASFAGVLLLDVLYHRAVSDPVAVLRAARRVLKPGGAAIVNVPAYGWLRSSHDLAVHTARRFTRNELRAMIENAGLRDERITYWNTLLFPIAAAVRLARRSSAREDSDLAEYRRGVFSPLLDGVLSTERFILQAVPLPVGLSVIAVVRR